ncbi:MAG: 23S rRNA (uridine2552-2'-O)-methyltransferase [Francisellaceae bacterium]|jgi:23S rRNA (uridine2552-2'-O)-methyltransferase
MARSRSSKDWLDEHFADAYVKQSKIDGYRCRAAYKLIELNNKYNLITKGMTIVDLGSAPGSWSQVASNIVSDKGNVFALDILEMDPIVNVDFIRGDFTEDEPYQELLSKVENKKIDWVISDMAPNISGNKTTDQIRSLYLVEIAVDFAEQTLTEGGSFLSKVFQGKGFDQLILKLRLNYKSVVIKKPDSSRARSSEVYIIARDKIITA